MNCRKCKKEISADSAFCNFCGTRVKKPSVGMRLYDHIRYLSDADAKKCIQRLASLPANQIKEKLQERQEAVFVYLPKLTYILFFGGRRHHYTADTSITELGCNVSRLLKDDDIIKPSLEICIKKVKLTGVYNPMDEGVNWFRSAKECENAIREGFDCTGINITIYDEE